MATSNDYRTLEEIRKRKNELRLQIDRDNQRISNLWNGIFVKHEDSTRGQFISSIISNSALAIDAFLLMRKLRRNYNSFSGLFGRKKRR